MTDNERKALEMARHDVLELAHREAWRYKKSSDPHHSDTYTFNRSTLLEFARKLIAIEREACAKVCEEIASDDNPQGHNECDGAMACLLAIRERSNA